MNQEEHPNSSMDDLSININSARTVEVFMAERTGAELEKDRIDRYKKRNAVFVETDGYLESKNILETEGHVLITGIPGEGKSTIAIQLLLDFHKKGYKVVKLYDLSRWQSSVNPNIKQIVLLDDIFGVTSFDINEIKTIDRYIEDITITNKTLVVLVSRKSFLRRALRWIKSSPLFYPCNTVDLSGDFALKKSEKEMILQKHLNHAVEKGDSIEDVIGSIDNFAKTVANVECPTGFPQIVHMFARQHGLLKQKANFFKEPLKYLKENIDKLAETDPGIYALMLFIAIHNGRLVEQNFATCLENNKHLLDKCLRVQITIADLKNVAEIFDEIYVKRFTEEGNVGFQHQSTMNAMCVSFGSKCQSEAIQYLPFENVFRMFQIDVDPTLANHIKLSEHAYEYLADRFIAEVLIGNIQSIVCHKAFQNPMFAQTFIKRIPQHELLIAVQTMERELDVRETFNGSLLYWAAVAGMEALCEGILKVEIIEMIENKHWLKMQLSAALVYGCNHGFRPGVINKLLKLGADPLCSFVVEKKYDITHCDICTLRHPNGTNPFNAVFMAEKQNYTKDVLCILLQYAEYSNKKLKTECLNAALIEATKCNNTECVQYLISQVHSDIEVLKKTVNDCMLYSINNANDSLMDLFFSKGASVEDIEYPLHCAKTSHAVRTLVQNGGRVNCKDTNGSMPLHCAANADVANTLLELNADISAIDSEGKTPLEAAKTTDVAKTLLKSCQNNQIDLTKYLAKVQNEDLLQLLIVSGAEVNTSIHLNTDYSHARSDGERTIYRRSNSSDTPTASEYEPPCNAKSDENCVTSTLTPRCLDNESIPSDQNVNRPLFCQNLILSSGNILRTPCLHQAKLGIITKAAFTKFLEFHIDINESDGSGNILHHVLSPEQEIDGIQDICAILIERITDIDSVDHEGNTALHLACSSQKVNRLTYRQKSAILERLKSRNADLTKRNKAGETPLDKLVQGSKHGIVTLVKCLIGDKSDIINDIKPLELLCATPCSTLIEESEAADCAKLLFSTLFKDRNIDRDRFQACLLKCFDYNKAILRYVVKSGHICTEADMLPLQEKCLSMPDCADAWDILNSIRGNQSRVETATGGNLCKLMMHENVDTFDDIENMHVLCYLRGICQSNQKPVKIPFNRRDLQGRTYLMNIPEFVKKVEQDMHSSYLGQSYDESRKIITQMIEIMLQSENKIDVNAIDQEGKTALHYFIESRLEDDFISKCVRNLLSHGARPSTGLLLLAARNKNPRRLTIEALLGYCADKNEKDEEGDSVVHALVNTYCEHSRFKGEITSALRILRKHCVAMNERDRKENTALQYAVRRFQSFDSAHAMFNSGFIQALLEAGADPNVTNKKTGRSVLHDAVTYNNYRETDLVKVLVKTGAKIQHTDKNGRNILHLAVMRMNHDSVKTALYLLRTHHGSIDVNLQDCDGRTALHLLIKNCKHKTSNTPESTSTSYNDGVSDKTRDSETDNKSDHMWCGSLRTSVMQCLLLYGADVNKRDKKGKSCLDCVVEQYGKCLNCRCFFVQMAFMIVSKKTCSNQTKKFAADYAKQLNLNNLQNYLKGDIKEEKLMELDLNLSLPHTCL